MYVNTWWQCKNFCGIKEISCVFGDMGAVRDGIVLEIKKIEIALCSIVCVM